MMEDKKIFSFQDYLEYQDKVNKSLHNDESTLFFNESIVHASIVTRAIIEKSISAKTPINMFCGEFSLFRKGFKEHLSKIKVNLDSDPDTKKRQNEFEKFDPYNDLIKSLTTFFEQNQKLNVIIANTIDGIKKEDIWSNTLESNLNKGNLVFYKLNTQFEIDHFMVSGHAFRKEISGDAKTAICSINRKEYADILQESFNILKKYSTEIVFS